MSDITLTRRSLLGAGCLLVGGAAIAGGRAILDDGDDAGGSDSIGPSTQPRASHLAHHTRYGINANTGSDVMERQALLGEVGIARMCYAGMLPATWDSAKEGSSPQRACHISFKTEPAAIANGSHDESISSWLRSIPPAWQVYLTFWHEPNDELREGRFTAVDFRRAWTRLSTLVRTTTDLNSGVVVQPVPVFTAYQVGVSSYWSDDWVPTPDEVPFLSWDIYGNPEGGAGLSGGYPTPQSCIDPCLQATQRIGHTSWGVSEFNTPTRSWDAEEEARRTWLANFRTYARSPQRSVATYLGAPVTLLLWEGDGVNWDQTIQNPATWNWWRDVVRSGD